MARLLETAQALVDAGRGQLAMDESNPTCDERFATAGIPQTVEARRAYRELVVTTPGLGARISGAILYDETIRQRDRHSALLVEWLLGAGIILGTKVDTGAKPLALVPSGKIAERLDGLRGRLAEYAGMGARFAKQRAVLGLERGQPSHACIRANAQVLARYAALCQDAGIVPIVEPEVLMAGNHAAEQSRVATGDVLEVLFEELASQSVMPDGVIVKPNMVLPGLACPRQETVQEVAGIAFLSGGQSARLASERLDAINLRAVPEQAPWPLVFSFARAIQQPALDLWRGKEANVAAAQRALHHRAWYNHAALSGQYSVAMEEDPAYQTAS